MKRSTIASFVALAFSTSAFATETINLGEIVIVANRVPQSRDSVIGDVSVISREDIERAGQSTLTELLGTQPGIEIDSSGSIGSDANVRIRGNNAQATVVLIDGMRVSSATAGKTNLSQILPDQIDHIEILRGPASSLYGADAIGGVIQIFTLKGKGKPKVSVSAGLGSHNLRDVTATVSGSNETTSGAFGVSSLTTNSISRLRVNSGFDSENDPFRNLSVNANINHTITEDHEIGAHIYISQAHLETGNSKLPSSTASLQQIFSVTSKNKISNSWLSSLTIGESTDDQKFEDVKNGNSAFRTNQRQIYWENDLKVAEGRLLLAFDQIEDTVKSDINFSNKSRSNNGYLASYILEQGTHAYKFGLRRDENSQFGGYTTGNVGYGYKIDSNWRTTASYGTAYRTPTFNDLYYPFSDLSYDLIDPDSHITTHVPYTYEGNKNLKPENSTNKEISLTYDQGHHILSATAYQNKINDLIVGTNGTSVDSPANIGKASINGITLAYEGWVENFHLRASADMQDPKNEDTNKVLARRSKQHGTIWLGQSWGKLEIGSEIVASGKRYNDPDNEVKLAGYTLFNLSTKYKLDDSWSINARINNLFDRKYALATTATAYTRNLPDYNTLGTNIFVSVRWSPK